MIEIYKLKHNDDSWGHIDFIDHQRGAYQIPVDSEVYNDIGGMQTTRDLELPKAIYLAADYNIIPEVDYPHNSLLADVLSKKMLSVFTELSQLEFRTVPVIMFDHKELEAYHIEEGELLDDLKRRNVDYVALQLLKYTDAFDRENAEFEENFLDPDEVGYIEKLVLKEPADGFPSLFRIKEDITKLFVTEQAKDALEAAGIKGCVFEKVEVSG